MRTNKLHSQASAFLRQVQSPDLSARDAIIALILAAGTLLFVASGAGPYKLDWQDRTFYQSYYATAVMSVCGHGWYSTPSRSSPELYRFLALESNTFDCEDLSRQVTKLAPNYQAVNHQYLFRSVALTWKLSGQISWTGLWPLFGVLAALVSGLAYGIGRLAAGRLLSAGMTLAFLPFHLEWLPYLRDYGKVPFILVNLLILGHILRKPPPLARLLGLAAVLGANTGIGLGFRPDVWITVPVVVLGLLIFLPLERRFLVGRTFAPLVFLVTAMLAYAPVLRFEKTKYTTSHVALLGYSEKFTRALALESPVYDWGRGYSDPLVIFQVKAKARFEFGRDEGVAYYDAAYGEISRQEFLHRTVGFPADTLVRAYAAALRLIKVPFLVGAILLVIWSLSGRLALFLLLLTLYITGYSSVQFHPRHYFYLELVALWYLALAAQGLITLGLSAKRDPGGLRASWHSIRSWWRAWRLRFLAGTLAVAGLLWIPLTLLRSHQDAALAEQFSALDSAALRDLDLQVESLSPGSVHLRPRDLLQSLPASEPKQSEIGMLVVLVNASACPSGPIEFTIRFEPARYNYSRQIRIDRQSQAPAKIFQPIYSRIQSPFGSSAFLGVEVDQETRNCLELKTLERLEDFPPILAVHLRRDWREQPLHMVFDSRKPHWLGKALIKRPVIRWKNIVYSILLGPSLEVNQRVEPTVILREDFEDGLEEMRRNGWTIEP